MDYTIKELFDELNADESWESDEELRNAAAKGIYAALRPAG